MSILIRIKGYKNIKIKKKNIREYTYLRNFLTLVVKKTPKTLRNDVTIHVGQIFSPGKSIRGKNTIPSVQLKIMHKFHYARETTSKLFATCINCPKAGFH